MGYQYLRSERKYKKLKVFVNGHWIHFGDRRFQHFHDQTGLLPKALNHGDEKRRASYRARAEGIRDGRGRLTVDDPTSANYHAVRMLW